MKKASLTGGRLIAKNAIFNLAGNVATIIIALVSVPVLLRYMGADRFGVISLVWIVEGQFGIFDLGLSQALTKLVSEKLGQSQESETPPIFWTSLALLGTLGIIGGIALWFLAPSLVEHVLNIQPAIQHETLNAFHLVAISLPIVITGSALRGVLAAHQRFDLLNITRVPISLASYIAPLLVLPFFNTLAPVVLVLVLARVLAWIIHFILCFKVSPVLRHNITFQNAPIRRMFGFGGWMTVTNIVGPIMVNLDRFMLGSLLSMKAVAQYATPYEAATKLWIVPSSLTGVLFPALSATLASDKQRASLLYEKAVKCILLCMFPITLVILALGAWGLEIWLGNRLGNTSAIVLQLLVVGVFANSLAQIPFWLIQAAGRPDLPAKVHLIELPCYLAVFYFLTTNFGVSGAATAWALRTVIDTAVMYWLSGCVFPEGKPVIRKLFVVVLSLIPLLVLVSLKQGLLSAVLCLSASLAVFVVMAWFYYLTIDERLLAVNFLQRGRLRPVVAGS